MATSEPEQRVIAGRYRLRSMLGAGSMGTVWSAYDEFLHRAVAVKEVRLPPGFPAAQAEELRERTLREARAIASLSHPNVITLYDVVREGDEPFVVMEQLAARSLAGLLDDHGPLSVAQAATIGDAVAAALHAAHAAGITHRDVKPGNVLVARDGRVKLTDFGIARNVSEATMTHTGMMLGSPAYMAPEVASGKKVSAAADLWGLGATLFAMVEGRPPYDADGDPLATASAVVHDAVPAPSEGPLAALISALMSKDPSGRPALTEVRARLVTLRTQAEQPLFAAELFDRGGVPEVGAPEMRGVSEVGVPEVGVRGEVGVPEVRGVSSPSATAPLAADPGPLPFAAAAASRVSTTAPAVRRRGPLATTALALIAVLLFAAAGAGGFALVRWARDAPLLPPGTERAAAPAATPTRLFEERTAQAATAPDQVGAQFRVSVPSDWTKFITEQPDDVLPASILVQFVSPDGRQVLGVERFADYFTGHDIDGYLDALESYWQPGNFVRVGEDGPADGTDTTLTYRTVDDAVQDGAAPGDPDAGKLGRTTFARLVRADATLWVVSVTVPTDQETRGRAQLFDRIAPTFSTP